MVDLTTIENDAEQALLVAEQILPNLFSLPPWLLPVLQAAAKAIATVSGATGTTGAEASSAVVDHLTPGKPAAAALQ